MTNTIKGSLYDSYQGAPRLGLLVKGTPIYYLSDEGAEVADVLLGCTVVCGGLRAIRVADRKNKGKYLYKDPRNVFDSLAGLKSHISK